MSIIDDREGLYSHVSDAIRAGDRMGREELYRLISDALMRVSVEQEQDMSELGTRGFHVAQACCGAAKRAFDALQARKKVV